MIIINNDGVGVFEAGVLFAKFRECYSTVWRWMVIITTMTDALSSVRHPFHVDIILFIIFVHPRSNLSPLVPCPSRGTGWENLTRGYHVELN